MNTAATTEMLTTLYEELAAPSATAFLKALRARGVSVRESDIREWIQSKSERQILQPGNRYSGKIAAFYQNDRWSADLINYTSRHMVGSDGKKYAHILIVQDMFTRFIRTQPMVSVTETADAFAKMLAAGARPRAITVDKGPEFKSAKFRAVADKNGIMADYKDAQDANGGLARLDTAIGQFKRSARRLQERGRARHGSAW